MLPSYIRAPAALPMQISNKGCAGLQDRVYSLAPADYILRVRHWLPLLRYMWPHSCRLNCLQHAQMLLQPDPGQHLSLTSHPQPWP